MQLRDRNECSNGAAREGLSQGKSSWSSRFESKLAGYGCRERERRRAGITRQSWSQSGGIRSLSGGDGPASDEWSSGRRGGGKSLSKIRRILTNWTLDLPERKVRVHGGDRHWSPGIKVTLTTTGREHECMAGTLREGRGTLLTSLWGWGKGRSSERQKL